MTARGFGRGLATRKKPSAKHNASYPLARTNHRRQPEGQRSLPQLESAVRAPPVRQYRTLVLARSVDPLSVSRAPESRCAAWNAVGESGCFPGKRRRGGLSRRGIR